MMRCIALAVVFILCGCDADGGKEKDRITSSNGYHLEKSTVMIDGKTLSCIGVGHQLSCNWDKYNKQ